MDAAASVGFKIMYDVGQQQDDCGDPVMYNLKSNATCFVTARAICRWLRLRGRF